MSVVADLVAAYTDELGLPWSSAVSPGERVWTLVYPPSEERRVRGHLGELRSATVASGRGWHEVDVTDDFGRWVASHRYANALFANPRNLTTSALEGFEDAVAEHVRDVLGAAGPDDVVALVGTGALFPFVRVSRLIGAVERSVAGRLLVLFPGRVDTDSHSYRLLDARDGFNYRARAITTRRDAS